MVHRAVDKGPNVREIPARDYDYADSVVSGFVEVCRVFGGAHDKNEPKPTPEKK
jgi:hypothetical protein